MIQGPPSVPLLSPRDRTKSSRKQDKKDRREKDQINKIFSSEIIRYFTFHLNLGSPYLKFIMYFVNIILSTARRTKPHDTYFGRSAKKEKSRKKASTPVPLTDKSDNTIKFTDSKYQPDVSSINDGEES